MHITHVKDYATLSNMAAGMVAEYVVNGKKNIALPTGNTPIGMYERLVEFNLDWTTTKTWNLDEYLDCEYQHTFQYYMMRHLFSKVNIPEQNTHFPIPNSGQRLVSWYDCLIEDSGGLDLTVLGIGLNGHLAYNEPGSPLDSESRTVQLSDSTRLGLVSQFDSIDMVPRWAETMGLATIMKSRRILLLACGVAKLSVLKQALWGPICTDMPASVLQQHNSVTVLYCD